MGVATRYIGVIDNGDSVDEDYGIVLRGAACNKGSKNESNNPFTPYSRPTPVKGVLIRHNHVLG